MKYSQILKYFIDHNKAMFMNLPNQEFLLKNFLTKLTYTFDTQVRFFV